MVIMGGNLLGKFEVEIVDAICRLVHLGITNAFFFFECTIDFLLLHLFQTIYSVVLFKSLD